MNELCISLYMLVVFSWYAWALNKGDSMPKLTKLQANNAYLEDLRSKGFEYASIDELPYPESAKRCVGAKGLGLAIVLNMILIKDEVK